LTGKYNDGIPENSRLNIEEYDWLREKLVESEQGKEKLEKIHQLSTIANELNIRMA